MSGCGCWPIRGLKYPLQKRGELVKVHEGGAVELIMKYGDIYELTIQSIKEVQEAM